MAKQAKRQLEGVEERNARSPDPMDIHVGSRVRLRRMLLGMSQEKLGHQLGLTFQQVQKYEKGVNRIGASRLFDLSKTLGVPIDYFYEDAPLPALGMAEDQEDYGTKSDDHPVFDFLSTREGLELNKAFVRINEPRIRRSIVELVRSLAGESQGS
ncbi:MAG: helix-turn-helix transcriptional regulator [Alphaproteobacteria bacterium]|nr:helix-turn-helix transcriptional regulator [Alphaproteobacteria bacterium]